MATPDRELARSLGHALGTQGYRAVDAAPAAEIELVERLQPVLILLDLDRRTDAIAAILRLRDVARTTPVIVLSERTAEGDKVTALDVGADDYVAKPYGASELLARIRVALRHARSRSAVAHDVVQVGPIRMDLSRYEVTVDAKPIHLTPIEFRLLAVLARDAGRVLPHERLLHEVWGPDTDQAHYLRVYIAALRHKLEPDPAHPRWLVTVTGVGYRLRDS